MVTVNRFGMSQLGRQTAPPGVLTFLDELSPSLGPLGQLLTVGLLNLGTFLKAAHEVVAESVAVIDPFDGALVVSHLCNRHRDKRREYESDSVAVVLSNVTACYNYNLNKTQTGP